MGLFSKPKKNVAISQLEQYIRIKQLVKAQLFERLTAQYDTRNQEQLENIVLLGQVINYLMADELGDMSDETPEETKAIIRKVKDEVPLIAHKVMEDKTIKGVVIGLLQLQTFTQQSEMGAGVYDSTRQGKLTTALLKQYDPDDIEMEPSEFLTLLKKIGVEI